MFTTLGHKNLKLQVQLFVIKIYQFIFVHGFFAQNDGQELIEGDVLKLGTDDSSSLCQ